MPFKKQSTLPVRFCAALVIALQFFSGLTPPVQAAPAEFPAPRIQTAVPLSDIRIPEELGEISESHAGSTAQTFILLQDVHAIGETQRSISRILRLLERKYGVVNFAVEGGEGTMDPLLLETIPARAALKKELEQLMRAGELSGTVPAALLGQTGRAQFFGIEKQALYEDEIRLYLRNLTAQASALGKLKKIRLALEQQKKQCYSPEARKLDRWLNALDRQPQKHASAVHKILKLGRPEAGRYPALANLSAKPGKEAQPIELQKAHHEWEAFTKELYGRWLRSVEQKKLREQDLRLKRLENLARIRLNAKEWRVLEGDGLSKEISIFEELDENDFDLARQFYETARQRDQVFLARLLAISSEREKDGPVVFVSGGFHSEGLRSELRRMGASYLVITPRFSEGLDIERYHRLMQDGQSWNSGNPSAEFSAFHAYLLKRLFPRMTFGQIKSWRDEILRRLAREGRLKDAGFYTRIFDASLREFMNSEESSTLVSRAAQRWDSLVSGLSAMQNRPDLTQADLLPLFQHQNVSPRDKPLIRAGWRLSDLSLPANLPSLARSEVRSPDDTGPEVLTYKAALSIFLEGGYEGEDGKELWEKAPLEVRRRFVTNLAKLKTEKLREAVSESQRDKADKLGIHLPQQGFLFETRPHQLVRADFIGESAIRLGKTGGNPGRTLKFLYDLYEERLGEEDDEADDGAKHADHVMNLMLADLNLDPVERIRQWGRKVPEQKKILKVTEFLEFLLTHEWDPSTIVFQRLDFERGVYDLLAHHTRFFRSKWVTGNMNNRHFSRYGIQAELGFLTSFFAKGKLGTQFYPYLEIASVILALKQSEEFREEFPQAAEFDPRSWSQGPHNLQRTIALAREILRSKKIRSQTMQTGVSRDLGTQAQQDFRRKYGIILGVDLTQRIYSNLFRDDLEEVFYFQHLLKRSYQELESLEISRVLQEELEDAEENTVLLNAAAADLPDYRVRLNAERKVVEVWSLNKDADGTVVSADRRVLLNEKYSWPAETSYEQFTGLVGKKRGLYSALITQRVFIHEGKPALRVDIENRDDGTAKVKKIQTYERLDDGSDAILNRRLYQHDLEFEPEWQLEDWRARAGDAMPASGSLNEEDDLPSQWGGAKHFSIDGKKQKKGFTADVVFFKKGAVIESIKTSGSEEPSDLVTIGDLHRIVRSVVGASDDEFYEDEHLLTAGAADFVYDVEKVTGSKTVRAPTSEETEAYWKENAYVFSQLFKSRTFYTIADGMELPVLRVEVDPAAMTVLRLVRFEHDAEGRVISQEEWTPKTRLNLDLNATQPELLYGSKAADETPAGITNWNLPVWQAHLKTLADLTKRTWFDETGVEQLSLDLGTPPSTAGGTAGAARMLTGARITSLTGEKKVFSVHPALLKDTAFQPRTDAARWREKLEPLLPVFSAAGYSAGAADGWSVLVQEASMEGSRTVYPALARYLTDHKANWEAHGDPQRIVERIKEIRSRVSHKKELLALALSAYQTYLETGQVTAAATHELHDFIEKQIDPALVNWVGRLESSVSGSWHTVLPRHMAFLLQSEIQRELDFSPDKRVLMKLFLHPIPANALGVDEAVQFAQLLMKTHAGEEEEEGLEEAEEADEAESPEEASAAAKPMSTLADKLRWALETVSVTEGVYKEHLALLRQLGVDMKQYVHMLSQLNDSKTPEFLSGLLERSLFSLKTKAWLSALWTLDYIEEQELKVSRAIDAGSLLYPASEVKPQALGADAEILDAEEDPVMKRLRQNSDSPRWNQGPLLKLEEAALDPRQQGRSQLVTAFFKLQNRTPEEIGAFLKLAHQLLQTGGHVIITLPSSLNLESAGLAQIQALGFKVKQGFASNRLQNSARELLLKGGASAEELGAAAKAEAVIYGRGFYVLDLEKTGQAPSASAAVDQLVFTSWHRDALVRDDNPKAVAEAVRLQEDQAPAKVLEKIRPQDLEFVPLQQRVSESPQELAAASAEQHRLRVVFHGRILNLIHRYRHLLLRTVKDSRREAILQLLGAFYEDHPPMRDFMTGVSPAAYWTRAREMPETLWSEPLFAAAKKALDTLLKDYTVLSLYPDGAKAPGFDFENLFTDRLSQRLLKYVDQQFADDTYLFQDEALRAQVPVIYEKWKKAEEQLTLEEIETWLTLRALMREYQTVLDQIELGNRGLRSQKVLESGYGPTLGRDPYDFAAALAAEEILKDIDQSPGGIYFDLYSGKGILMRALHDGQESRLSGARHSPDGTRFTLYQADPNAEDLTITPPEDWSAAPGLIHIEAGLSQLPKETKKRALAGKVRILTLINVLHRFNAMEAQSFFQQSAQLLEEGGRILLTIPAGLEMSAQMRAALHEMGFELSPPRKGTTQISQERLDEIEAQVLAGYQDEELARRVRLGVQTASRRRFAMIQLTIRKGHQAPVQSEILKPENFLLERPVRKKKPAEGPTSPAVPTAERPENLIKSREVLSYLHQSDAGGRYQIAEVSPAPLIDRAEAVRIFPELESENALTHLYRYRALFSNPEKAEVFVRLIEENYDYWRFESPQLRREDIDRLRQLYLKGREASRGSHSLFTKEELRDAAAGRKDEPYVSLRDKLDKQLPKIQASEMLFISADKSAGKALPIQQAVPEEDAPTLLHVLQRDSGTKRVWSVQRLASLEHFLSQRQSQQGLRRAAELLRDPPRPIVSRRRVDPAEDAAWQLALQLRQTPWQEYLNALEGAEWAAPELEQKMAFALYVASLYQLLRDHPENGVVLPDEEYEAVFARLASLNGLSAELLTQKLQAFRGSFWQDLHKLPPTAQDLIEKINALEDEETERERKQREGGELGSTLHQDYLQIRKLMTAFLSGQNDRRSGGDADLMAFVGKDVDRLALSEMVLDNIMMSGDYSFERMQKLQDSINTLFKHNVYNNADMAFRVTQRMGVLVGLGNLAIGERIHLAAFTSTRLHELLNRFKIRAAVEEAFPGQDADLILARLIKNTYLRRFMDTSRERTVPEGSDLLNAVNRMMRDFVRGSPTVERDHAGVLAKIAGDQDTKSSSMAFVESVIENNVPATAQEQREYFEMLTANLKLILLKTENLEEFHALASRLARYKPEVYGHLRPIFMTFLNMYFHTQGHRHEFLRMFSALDETRVRDWAAILGFNAGKSGDFVNLNEFKFIEESLLEAFLSDTPLAAYQAARLMILYEQGDRRQGVEAGPRNPAAVQLIRTGLEQLYLDQGVDLPGPAFRLIAGLVTDAAELDEFTAMLQRGIEQGLKDSSFQHVFYPKLERFFRVLQVRFSQSDDSEEWRNTLENWNGLKKPSAFSEWMAADEARRTAYQKIFHTEALKFSRFYGREAVTHWLRGHGRDFEHETNRAPKDVSELALWAAGLAPQFPLEKFPGHMLGGSPENNPLAKVMQEIFQGYADLNEDMDSDMQRLGGILAREHPEAKLYPNFQVWIKDPLNESHEFAMGVTFAAVNPGGDAVIYILAKDHPDPVISSHDPYFYRREIQSFMMTLRHLTQNEAFVKRQGFKTAKFVLLLNGMESIKQDPPPLPENVSIQWVSDFAPAPTSRVRIEADYYDPKSRSVVSGSDLGASRYQIAEVADLIHHAYTRRMKLSLEAASKNKVKETPDTPLQLLDAKIMNDMELARWTHGERPGSGRPSHWTLGPDEREEVEVLVRKLLSTPTREERGLYGNLLQMVRKKNFVTNMYARFYLAYLSLTGLYETSAVDYGARAVDNIYLGDNFYQPAGDYMEQLLAIEDASLDPTLPEGLRRMFHGYFQFLFSHHLAKPSLEDWAVQHPRDTAFGPFLASWRQFPGEKTNEVIHTQMLHCLNDLVIDAANRQAADKLREALKKPVYQGAVISLIVQFNNKVSELQKGQMTKMTEARLKPVSQVLFGPEIPFETLLNYFIYAEGIYNVWHKQYDYDSNSMRWLLKDLWGEIDRRLGTGAISETEFLSGVFDHLFSLESMVKLMAAEPVILSNFSHIRKSLVKAMTGPEVVLSSRVFNFLAYLQQSKIKGKGGEERVKRRLDGDDNLLREGFLGIFEREGFSPLSFQLLYSLTPGFHQARSVFFQAAEEYILNHPASEQPALIAAEHKGAQMLAALAGNLDVSGFQKEAAEQLGKARELEMKNSEFALDGFSPGLRKKVQGYIRDIFSTRDEWTQRYLAEELKRLIASAPTPIYIEFEAALAVSLLPAMGPGRSIEQIAGGHMALFRAGIDLQASIFQHLTQEDFRTLEVDYAAVSADRPEEEARMAALTFNYFNKLVGQSYKGREADFPVQNRFDEDLTFMEAGVTKIQNGLRAGNALEVAAELYPQVFARYSFENLTAMKAAFRSLRLTHDEPWTAFFLASLETAVRAAHDKGERVDAAEINNWIITELAHRGWPKRRILKVLADDGQGRTRFTRLMAELAPEADEPEVVQAPPAPVVVPQIPVVSAPKAPKPAAAAPAKPEGSKAEGQKPEQPPQQPLGTRKSGPPQLLKQSVAPVPLKPALNTADILTAFEEVLKKTPDELRDQARTQTMRITAADDFAAALGFLLLSQIVGDGSEAASAKQFRALDFAVRAYDSALKKLEFFESSELFDQIWSMIPDDHLAAWFREESFSPERIVELDEMDLESITDISDYFDFFAYERARVESRTRSGTGEAVLHLDQLLEDPAQRQAFREKLQSNYFMQALWATPFLFNEELMVFDDQNPRFKNIRQTFHEIAQARDPRGALFLHDGFTLLHRNRKTAFLPEQPEIIKKGLRVFHGHMLTESGYFSYVQDQVVRAESGKAAAREFVEHYFVPEQIQVMFMAGVNHPEVKEQILQILVHVRKSFPALNPGVITKAIVDLKAVRSEVRSTADSALDVLVLERSPENAFLEDVLRVVRESRVQQWIGTMPSSGSAEFKNRLLTRLTREPVGLEISRPSGLPPRTESVSADAPLVWISSTLPELAALKTFARENPAAHVLLLLLPAQGPVKRSMRVEQFSSAEFPQIKIANPQSSEAFRRVLRNIPAQFSRAFSAEPVFVLNAEVEDRPEFEDITMMAEKAIEYSAAWQGRAFLPHHYLLLLDAAKLSQDLDLDYVRQTQTGKSWYRFDEQHVDRSILTDLGHFLTTQSSFTASA